MTESTPSAHEADRISALLWHFLGLAATDRAVTLNQAANWLGALLHAPVEIMLLDTESNGLIQAAASGDCPPPLPAMAESLMAQLASGILWRAPAQDGELSGSSASVPLLVDQRPVGLLVIGGECDASDALLQACGRGVGGLLQRLQAVEQHSAAASEPLRHRIFDQLAGVLAHDFGNLLAPLQGRLELLERRASRDQRERELRDIHLASEATQRLRQILHMLSDSGRVYHGTLTLQPELVDLTALAEQSVLELQPAHGVIARAELNPLAVMADPLYLRQTLDALARMAQALLGPDMAGSLRVMARHEAQQHWAVVELNSPGRGIEPAVMAELFSRFSAQLHGRMGGLGLYLARGIAEAHGGSLTVESVPEQSATLTLKLPAPASALA